MSTWRKLIFQYSVNKHLLIPEKKIFIKVKRYGITNAHETIPIYIQEQQVKQWNKVCFAVLHHHHWLIFILKKSDKILHRSCDWYFCADITEPMFGLYNSKFKQTWTKGLNTIWIYTLQLNNCHLEKIIWSDTYVDSPVSISPLKFVMILIWFLVF